MIYYPISGFQTTTINTTVGSLTSSLYIKDYLGNLVSSSFNNYYDNIQYIPIINLSTQCSNNGNIIFNSSESLSISINTGSYNENEVIFLPTGSYTASINNGVCTELYNFEIIKLPEIDFMLTTSSISCYNGNNGVIYINDITGGLPPYQIEYNVALSSSISSSNVITNLDANEYFIKITDSNLCYTEKSISLVNPDEITFSLNVIYDECYSTIEVFNISGGIPPYEIQIISPVNTSISTESNLIPLTEEGLNGYFITASVKDSLGCISSQLITEVYGRTYIYSGSYCEQE